MGDVKAGKGGNNAMKLADAPVSTQVCAGIDDRIPRIPATSMDPDDIRNCVGYAIAEDLIWDRWSLDRRFCRSYEADPRTARITLYPVSSVDPWHADVDANTGGGNQHTGFDLFFTSGITNDLPAMIPVTILYGTPDDAAAQIAYIEKRGYPISIYRVGRGTGRQARHAGGLRVRSISSGPRPFIRSIRNLS